jgi:hypothetical protein
VILIALEGRVKIEEIHTHLVLILYMLAEHVEIDNKEELVHGVHPHSKVREPNYS